MADTYILRTCSSDMTSHGGFRWPESGRVEAPDWQPTKECGHGLHGLLMGQGDGQLLDWDGDARWLVASVEATSLIDLEGKVKFPAAEVVFCGDRGGAIAKLRAVGAQGAIVGDIVLDATKGGSALAGDRGTATAGEGGTATAGYRGTATAGDRGTATAGDWGTATAGYRGTATAGYRGTIQIKRFDGHRWRIVTGYVGEEGVEPNVPYRLDADGKPIPAKTEAA